MTSRDEKQRDAVRAWQKNNGRGILALPTGFGKTRTAMIAIKSFLSKNKNKNILIIVPTDILKMQWALELEKFDLLSYVRIEIINSAVKSPENVDLLILDEIHLYLGQNYINIFNIKKPKLILGLSATFHRLDGRHNLITRICPVVYRISIKEALENNWLSDYREYKVLIEVPDFEYYQEASRKFQEMFSIFNFDFKEAMRCVQDIRHRRIYAKTLGIDHKDMDGITFTWMKNMKERKDFVNNHPKKLEIARKILEARPNSKAVVLTGTIIQAEKLGMGYIVHSGKTKKKNRLTLKEFNNLSTGIISSGKMLNTGVDIKGLNLAIILNRNSSPTTKQQSLGRVIRYEEGKLAEIFNLVIKNTVDEKWFENASQNTNYIEITEEELDDILNGQEVNRIEKEGRSIDQLFRM